MPETADLHIAWTLLVYFPKTLHLQCFLKITRFIWWWDLEDCSLLFISSISESTTMYTSQKLILHMVIRHVTRHFTVVGPQTDSLIYTIRAGTLKLLQGTSDCQQLCHTSSYRSDCWHQGKYVICAKVLSSRRKRSSPENESKRETLQQGATYFHHLWMHKNP